MRENADQNNSEYGHFSRSAMHSKKSKYERVLETISKLLVSSTMKKKIDIWQRLKEPMDMKYSY